MPCPWGLREGKNQPRSFLWKRGSRAEIPGKERTAKTAKLGGGAAKSGRAQEMVCDCLALRF